MSLSHRTRDCACGSGTVCQAITAAFYMIRDPRRGYIELPPYHPPVSQYYEQQNRIRNAYLRHLCPYRVDFPDEELPRNIALHHFHPEIVLEFAQQRHLSSRKNKVPLTVTQEEMERLKLGLGEDDRVLDPDGTPTSSYYFCPNYPMKNVQQDLKECVRRERNIRSQTEGTKKQKSSSGNDLRTRSRSHSRSRDESANNVNRGGIRSQSQRPESRGHSSKRSKELPPPGPQRYPIMDDSGYGTGPGDAILNLTVAVPASGGKLPPPPRDLKSPTPSDPSEGKRVAKAKPDVLIVPEASVGSGSRGRVNVYINFDEEQKPAEPVARIPSVQKQPVEYAVQHVPHRHHQSKRSKPKHEDADQIADDEVNALYRKKKRKEKLKRKKRDGALIIPTNIVLVCGSQTPEPTEGDHSEDVLMMNDHNTSTTGSMDEPVDEFSAPSGSKRISSPATYGEGVNPLNHKHGIEDDRIGVQESNARHTRSVFMDDFSDMNHDIDSTVGLSIGGDTTHESRALPNKDVSFVAPKYGAKRDNHIMDSSLDADREVARHIAAEMQRIDNKRQELDDSSVFEYLNSTQNDMSLHASKFGANSVPRDSSQQVDFDASGATNDYLSTSHNDILFVHPRYGNKSVPRDNEEEKKTSANAVRDDDVMEDSPPVYKKTTMPTKFNKDFPPKFKKEIDSDLDEKSLGWDERSDKSHGMEDRSADTPYGIIRRGQGMEDKSVDSGFGTEDRSDDGMDDKSDDGPYGMDDKSDDGPYGMDDRSDDAYRMDDKSDDGPHRIDDKSDDGPRRMDDKLDGPPKMDDKSDAVLYEVADTSEDGPYQVDDKSDDGPYKLDKSDDWRGMVDDKSDDGPHGMEDDSDDGIDRLKDLSEGGLPQKEQSSHYRSQRIEVASEDVPPVVEDSQEVARPMVSQTTFKRAVSDPPGELLNRPATDEVKSPGRVGPQSSPQSVAGFDMYVPQIQEKDYDEMEMTPEHFDDLNSTAAAREEIRSMDGSDRESGKLADRFHYPNSAYGTSDDSGRMNESLGERANTVSEFSDDIDSTSAPTEGSRRMNGVVGDNRNVPYYDRNPGFVAKSASTQINERDRESASPETYDDVNSASVADEDTRHLNGSLGEVGRFQASTNNSLGVPDARLTIHGNSEDYLTARDDPNMPADNASVNSRAMSTYSTASTAMFIGDVHEPSPFVTKRKDAVAAKDDVPKERLAGGRSESLKIVPEESDNEPVLASNQHRSATILSSENAKPTTPEERTRDREETRGYVAATGGTAVVDTVGTSFVNEASGEPKNNNNFYPTSAAAPQPVTDDQPLQQYGALSNQAVGQSVAAASLAPPKEPADRPGSISRSNEITQSKDFVDITKPNKEQVLPRHVDSRLPDEESVECSSKGQLSAIHVTSAVQTENRLPLSTNEARGAAPAGEKEVFLTALHNAEQSAGSESSSERKSASEESRRLDRSEESEGTGELTKMLLTTVENSDNVASQEPRLVEVNLDGADADDEQHVAELAALGLGPADIEALNFLELHANNQRLLDMLNVPMEIAFNKDDNSLHDVSVCFTESVMTSVTDFASPPPAKRKNLNELYGELIAWESKRRTRYASEIEETSIHWRCRKELLREGLLETAKAERLILGAAEAVKIFAETMQASYDDILIDDDGSLLTDSRKQNKVMLQRQSEFYSLGNTGTANVQEEKSALLDTLIKSQSVMSESFNQSAFVQNDVIEEMKNLRKQLQQQLSDFEKKGDRIVQGMKLAEEQVQKFWDEVDGALSDAAFSALNKASLNTSVDEDLAPTTPGRIHRKRDGWLVEMQYRVAVATENGVWECCKHELGELYEAINNLDFQRRNKMQQVLLAFLPRQRRLFLGLPGILEPVLDGYVAYRTDHETLEANVEDAIQKQSQCYLRYEHEHRSSIMNRSRSYKPDLVQESETIDSLFGYPFESSMVRLAKVVERNVGAVWGGTWKITLAVVTASRFLHLFEIPESPELESGISPMDALAALIPPVSDLAPANINDSSERKQAKNRSAELFKGLSPAVSINLTNSVLKESSKYPEHLDIIETLAGNFTSNRRRHTFRLANDQERAEWLTVLHDTKMCDDTTLSETVSDTEQSI